MWVTKEFLVPNDPMISYWGPAVILNDDVHVICVLNSVHMKHTFNLNVYIKWKTKFKIILFPSVATSITLV